VSAQNRQRYYWTNIEGIEQPKDRGVVLKDILEQEPVHDKYTAGDNLLKNYAGGNQLNPTYKSQANTIHPLDGKTFTLCAGTHGYANGYVAKKPSPQGLILAGHASNIRGHDSVKRVYDPEGKAPTLTTMGGGHREPKVIDVNDMTWRRLTCLECERLQTVPDGYTEVEGVSNTQRYKMLGNGFTVSIIAHILSYMEQVK
jgi:site-specific DNA-cytosine methylase